MTNFEEFIESIKKLCDEISTEREKSLSEEQNNIFVADNDSLLMISNEKYLTAKIIGTKGDAKTFVLSNRRKRYRDAMAKVYGFETLYYDKIIIKYLIIAAIKGLFYCLSHNGDALLTCKIGGINCGDLIYDSIIMRENRKFTIDGLRTRIAVREVVLMYYTYYYTRYLFRKYNPNVFIAQDLVYRDGFITRYAQRCGCDIVLLTTGRPTYVIQHKNDMMISFPGLYEEAIRHDFENLEEGWLEKADEEINKLYQGKWDWNAANAFKDKIVTERETLLEELGINNGKKNVVIMTHCFSDAPHGNGNGKELYKDYYTWLVETLNIADEISGVNWLVRPHPSRIHYGEEGEVEKVCGQHKSIHILSDKYSTLMVARIADCIITVNGSAGLELPCMGIPCINAGKPFYSQFGFSICPSSIDEYRKTLEKIDQIEALKEEQVLMAKKVLLIFHRIIRNNDGYADECYKIHQQYCVDKEVEAANTKYIDLFSKYVNDKSIKKTYNYNYAIQLIKHIK